MGGRLVQRGKKGEWHAIFEDGTKGGKRHRRVVNLHVTKKREAEDALARLLTAQQDGMLPEVDRELKTLGAWLLHWQALGEMAGKAPMTQAVNRRHIEGRIIPAIGHLRLDELKPAQLEKFYASELRAPRKDKKKLGPPIRTVDLEHRILHAALEIAVKQGVLPRNPADAVTRPRLPETEQKVLTAEQARALLTAAKGHRLRPLFFLALTACMREGELLGLRWSDVDLDAGMLIVRVQRQYLPGQGIAEKGTKGHRVGRPVELTPEEIAVLKRHQETQEDERRKAGPIWQDNGLVFPSEIGTPINPRNLVRLYKSLLNKAGLPDVRFHDLRHTAATLLLQSGARLNVVQQRLGHANPATTARIYAHVTTGEQRQAAAAVVASILPALGA